MIGIGSHNQIRATHFKREVGKGKKNFRDTHQTFNQQNKITLHLTRIKYTTQASCTDGKLNLGPKNSVQDHVWLCISFTGLTMGSSSLSYFILYSFLFAGSVDRDHERDGLSALCSFKSPDSLISIYMTVLH